MPRRSPQPVYGHPIEPCRITRGGLRVALTRLALPLIGILTAIELAIGAAVQAFGGCYGLVCWLS